MDFVKSQMQKQMFMVEMAPQIQQELREQYNDNNIIMHCYDRNKVMRVRYATSLGQAKGTCQLDTIQNFIDCEHQKLHPEIHQMLIEKPAVFKGNEIYHMFLTIKINGKIYVEDKSNGFHERLPYSHWLETKMRGVIVKQKYSVPRNQFVKAVRQKNIDKMVQLINASNIKRVKMTVKK